MRDVLTDGDVDVAQHYLVHLLREKLVESKARVVVVSSGAVRQVKDPGQSSFLCV